MSLDPRIMHYRLLSHAGLGVTELRLFAPGPRVGYVDNEADFIRLCDMAEPYVQGTYVGVQPRPPHLFDKAPNQWVRPIAGPGGNCGKDGDVEFLCLLYFDIDVCTPTKNAGHPASDGELQNSLSAAKLIANQPELEGSAVIACTGNGHAVMAPVTPIPCDSNDIAQKFKAFCQQIIQQCDSELPSGTRLDIVFNASRVMRIIGTLNRKGTPLANRPHRRAFFVTSPEVAPSYALHQRIINTDVRPVSVAPSLFWKPLDCNLQNLDTCEFIRWCRKYPTQVSEPHWFGLAGNLVHLKGGIELFHEISALDPARYDVDNTQRIIERILNTGYRPTNCTYLTGIRGSGKAAFSCSCIDSCPARCPMLMAVNRNVFHPQIER